MGVFTSVSSDYQKLARPQVTPLLAKLTPRARKLKWDDSWPAFASAPLPGYGTVFATYQYNTGEVALELWHVMEENLNVANPVSAFELEALLIELEKEQLEKAEEEYGRDTGSADPQAAGGEVAL